MSERLQEFRAFREKTYHIVRCREEGAMRRAVATLDEVEQLG